VQLLHHFNPKHREYSAKYDKLRRLERRSAMVLMVTPIKYVLTFLGQNSGSPEVVDRCRVSFALSSSFLIPFADCSSFITTTASSSTQDKWCRKAGPPWSSSVASLHSDFHSILRPHFAVERLSDTTCQIPLLFRAPRMRMARK
jgi:hypothetical protein